MDICLTLKIIITLAGGIAIGIFTPIHPLGKLLSGIGSAVFLFWLSTYLLFFC